MLSPQFLQSLQVLFLTAYLGALESDLGTDLTMDIITWVVRFPQVVKAPLLVPHLASFVIAFLRFGLPRASKVSPPSIWIFLLVSCWLLSSLLDRQQAEQISIRFLKSLAFQAAVKQGISFGENCALGTDKGGCLCRVLVVVLLVPLVSPQLALASLWQAAIMMVAREGKRD